jgi:L,D-transpeptidase ErfK/SrfK
MNALIFAVLLANITGGEFSYTVQPGDSLTSISARFGVEIRVLAEENQLKTADLLQAGQVLRIDNRHIAPAADGAAIVINVPQRMLFLFGGDQLKQASPVAVGQSGWKTPRGTFEVMVKETRPTWDVPVSIQEEMRRAGKKVLTRVPPSPQNPLGDYWIGLSLPGIGIHGTNAPSSIYRTATHGCIRLHPDDIRLLFSQVEVGTPGRTVYEPVLVTRSGDSIFLEVHRDAYRKGPDPLEMVMQFGQSEGVLDLIDLTLAEQVIRKREGIARDVTRRR